MGTLNSLLQETISGTRIVKAFCMEKYESKRFEAENERLFKLNMKSVSVKAISSPLMEFLGRWALPPSSFTADIMFVHGYSTPGTFFSFLAALLMLYEPVKRLTNVNNTINRELPAPNESSAFIDRVPDIQDKPGAKALPPVSYGINMENVTFLL